MYLCIDIICGYRLSQIFFFSTYKIFTAYPRIYYANCTESFDLRSSP